MSNKIAIESTRFGRFEVDESDLIHFPGLPGFPGAERFVVMQHDQSNVFAWLISVDMPDLALVVTEPSQFFPDYRPPMSERQLRALGVSQEQEMASLDVLAIASFRDHKVTLNLAAPLVVNVHTRRGTQVILEDDRFRVRQELPALESSQIVAAQRPAAPPDGGSRESEPARAAAPLPSREAG